uniref:Peroxisomal membrane protein PEX14 n=1 Tax=Fagus sylvatica TaxID=28930 RepID=A0A2N9HFX8_FAGSY
MCDQSIEQPRFLNQVFLNPRFFSIRQPVRLIKRPEEFYPSRKLEARFSRYSDKMLNSLIASLLVMQLCPGILLLIERISNILNTRQTNAQGRASFVDQEDHGVTISNSKQQYVNNKADNDLRSVRSSSPPTSAEPSVAPHPKSYMDIMAMIQRGERPPNIRDINDQPPNPNQQPSNPRLAPRAKPWEVSQVHNNSSQTVQSQLSSEGLNSKFQDNGITYQLNGDSSVPWWQRKNDKIIEIENGDELKAGSNGLRTSEQPVQRMWVPPQPPPVAMPEAAEAIRRPKQSVQREQLADDQSVAQPSDVTDELLRITKISESGGAVEVNGVEVNGGSSVLNSSEIQEHEQSIEQS